MAMAAAALSQDLIHAVYRAALEPAAWDEVMQLMRRRFPSVAQTFYFLHMQPHRVRPICLVGVEPSWVSSFDELYFAPDNPWVRWTQRLHQPGVVRTNERLDRFLQAPGVLYRCSYYNDWMRPQGFKYTIGNTLLAEAGVVANVTLLRAPDMKTFTAAEVRAFETMSRHMTRSLQMAARLQCPEASAASIAAFDAMPQAVALIDAQRQLLYANPAMEGLFARRQGLAVQQGRVVAASALWQQPFEAHVVLMLAAVGGSGAAVAPLRLPGAQHGDVRIDAMPVVGREVGYLPWRQTLLLTASTEPERPLSPAAASRRQGCTPSESRLAELMAEGLSLREAAQTMGITYGSARMYLKIVFHKLGVRTQSQLVARLLRHTR